MYTLKQLSEIFCNNILVGYYCLVCRKKGYGYDPLSTKVDVSWHGTTSVCDTGAIYRDMNEAMYCGVLEKNLPSLAKNMNPAR